MESLSQTGSPKEPELGLLVRGGGLGETPKRSQGLCKRGEQGQRLGGKTENQPISMASWLPRRRNRSRSACSSRATQPSRHACAGALGR